MKKPKITRNKGKGSNSERLPSRAALAKVTSGDPVQRSLGNYAKSAPTAEDSPSIFGGFKR